MKGGKKGTATTATIISERKIRRSLCIAKYIRTVQQANERTAVEYEYRLSKFEKYIVVHGKQQQQQQNQRLTTLDYVIEELKRKKNNNTKIDPYDLLSGFVVYLQQEENMRNPNTIRHFVITARNFLEYHDVEITPRKFKFRVRLPKPVIRRKEAIGKEEIREILLKCSDIKLKTYVMLLAVAGMRATEALALRHNDFDIDDNTGQAFVRIRGEFTKTRTDRYVFLTKELVSQCKAWIDFKYRRRRVTKVVNSGTSNYGNRDDVSSGGSSSSHKCIIRITTGRMLFYI